jgi:hypothetical protein
VGGGKECMCGGNRPNGKQRGAADNVESGATTN